MPELMDELKGEELKPTPMERIAALSQDAIVIGHAEEVADYLDELKNRDAIRDWNAAREQAMMDWEAENPRPGQGG
jgi:hypothetical protein